MLFYQTFNFSPSFYSLNKRKASTYSSSTKHLFLDPNLVFDPEYFRTHFLKNYHSNLNTLLYDNEKYCVIFKAKFRDNSYRMLSTQFSFLFLLKDLDKPFDIFASSVDVNKSEIISNDYSLVLNPEYNWDHVVYKLGRSLNIVELYFKLSFVLDDLSDKYKTEDMD